MKTLLLLHGWSKGISRKTYSGLIDLLSKKYKMVALDFPGFGETAEPERPWMVEDFAKWVREILVKQKINPEVIVGHSFGGRVAIKGVASGLLTPKKLILIDSAGVERKSLKIKLIGWVARMVPRSIKNKFNLGSKDWREVSGVMRETMQLVVSENLENEMTKIKVPTLLIWGSEDKTTPLWQARIMKSKIQNSKLKIVEEGNHGLPYRQPVEVAKIIGGWLK